MLSSRFVSVCRSSPAARIVTERLFASNCAPALKLRQVFEEYRQEHYSRETPTRFKKEVLAAAHVAHGTIIVDSLNNILVNIGRSDKLLSEDEIMTLLRDAGAKDRSIPADQMMDLV